MKTPKLFGKDEDGTYLGRIEMIGTGKHIDTIYLSTRAPYLWIFSLFNGYRQIGTFNVPKPNIFVEGQDVIIKKENDVVVEVKYERTGKKEKKQ